MAATEKTEAAVRPPLASAGAPPASPPAGPRRLLAAKEAWIAALSAAAILLHLLLRFAFHTTPAGYDWPLFIALAAGAVPQLFDLGRRLWRREFGSDLLAGLSIQ